MPESEGPGATSALDRGYAWGGWVGAESSGARCDPARREPRWLADIFGRLYDRTGGTLTADDLRPFRAQYQCWDETRRFEFLVLVAGHVATRLSREYPDGVARAGRQVADWFLR
jgi:hypothetical protein